MTLPILKARPEDAGCWIDGHWGVYGTTNVIAIAEAHGMPIDRNLISPIKCYERDEYNTHGNCYCAEIIFDASDSAENWLNGNVAPEGFSFGWHDGEFFLWPNDEWNNDIEFGRPL